VGSTRNSWAWLQGRHSERHALDRLVSGARAGTSGALVVRGEAGVGKSVLLDYLLVHAPGCRIVRASGIESEMELAYAGLHQVCAPFIDRLERLPAPQREALENAFGLRSGGAPDRFLVGLAVLTLLSEVAEEQPLICLLDDTQWLDHASTQVLGFVGRRLGAEGVVLLFAMRDSAESQDLMGLPELRLGPLADADARALLATAMPGRLDESVRDRIVAEARGNPLALLELPRAWTAAAFAGGFGLPDGVSVSGRIEESFRRRLSPLGPESRRLLLVAAADPTGDPVLVHAAAEQLGIPDDAAEPARAAGLLDTETQIRFRHPLVRTVVYRDSPIAERRLVHRALANATDPALDPDRRAWHRATAAAAPDEEVALDLVGSAGRAQARGGFAAAAALLQRAVDLTPDQGRRAERALGAAQASIQAGAFDAALGLLATVGTDPLDDSLHAQVELLRSHIAFASGLGREAPPLLLSAARGIEPFSLDLARETYLTAWGASVFTGRGDVIVEICQAVRALPPPPGRPRPIDLLLDGFALLTTDGRAAAAPVLREAAKGLVGMPVEDVLKWGWVATGASAALWDDEGMRVIYSRQVQVIRDAGALAALPIHLSVLGMTTTWTGDLEESAAIIAEGDSAARATGVPIAPYPELRLMALRGREAEAAALIAGTIQMAAASGQEMGVISAHWAAAVLYNGLGRYEEAMSAAQATANTFEPWISTWALPELVEAAARSGASQIARAAFEELAKTTRSCDTDWALGVEARAHALVADDGTAEDLYQEAIARLARTALRPELARAHLLYGEWLRRIGRRVDAREQLRAGHGLFLEIGMDVFAERARRELLATGEKVRKRSVETIDELTPQELQIAKLARDGLSNPEISARLFLSPRTIEWHLRKVFSKLGIVSRKELRYALPGASRTAVGVSSASDPRGP
jgi:DNA-binding CsgD family transcriptional regulator